MKKNLTPEQIVKIKSLMNDLNNKPYFVRINDERARFTIEEKDGRYELHGNFIDCLYVQGGKYLKGSFDRLFGRFGERHNVQVGKAKQVIYGSYKCLIFG